jgi:hypothetical protein
VKLSLINNSKASRAACAENESQITLLTWSGKDDPFSNSNYLCTFHIITENSGRKSRSLKFYLLPLLLLFIYFFQKENCATFITCFFNLTWYLIHVTMKHFPKSQFSLGYTPRKIESKIQRRYLYTNGHNSVIYNTQKMKTHMSADRWVD